MVDADFIAEHTHEYEKVAEFVRATGLEAIEGESGLVRDGLERAAGVYANAKAVIGVFGMGLTQHRRSFQNVQMLSNLLLLGGHISRPGAGICSVRGHSSVQGQRTVSITEKPGSRPLDKLVEPYAFDPPRDKCLNTVKACEGGFDGSVRAVIGRGGNFIRAVPDTLWMSQPGVGCT